tara:strand:+ start:1611 stop:2237 length:627 start_codon:yes stop_codon:yes gene_type:complete
MTEAEIEMYNSLADYWNGVVQELKQSLKDAGRNASGNTAAQFGVPPNSSELQLVTFSSKGYSIKLYMPSYYVFLDKGVDGVKKGYGSPYKYKDKMPPIKAIRRFMLNRGIATPRAKKKVPYDKEKAKAYRLKRKLNKGRVKNTRSGKKKDINSMLNGIAFLIARSIYNKGLKPTNFYSNVINSQKFADFEEKLKDKYADYIIDVVRIE